jgi:hypothetical protein
MDGEYHHMWGVSYFSLQKSDFGGIILISREQRFLDVPTFVV